MPSAYTKNRDGKTRDSDVADSAQKLKDRGLSPSPKQIRARARRAAARGRRVDAEIDLLYKPLDEWDEEELSKGVPREMWGRRTAGQLAWLPRAVHEEIITRYQVVVKSKVQEMTLPALRVMNNLLENEDTDRRGRPVVSASVKFQCATFLLEHVIGKPTQKIEGEVSVKLEGLLAHVMVVPGQDEEAEAQVQGFLGHEHAIEVSASNQLEEDEDDEEGWIDDDS